MKNIILLFVMMLLVPIFAFVQEELVNENSEGAVMIADTNVRDAEFIEKTDEFVEL